MSDRTPIWEGKKKEVFIAMLDWTTPGRIQKALGFTKTRSSQIIKHFNYFKRNNLVDIEWRRELKATGYKVKLGALAEFFTDDKKEQEAIAEIFNNEVVDAFLRERLTLDNFDTTLNDFKLLVFGSIAMYQLFIKSLSNTAGKKFKAQAEHILKQEGKLEHTFLKLAYKLKESSELFNRLCNNQVIIPIDEVIKWRRKKFLTK